MNEPAQLSFHEDRTDLILDGHQLISLTVSPARLAAAHWPDGRPTPLQLEHAIDAVEGAIELAHLRHAERGSLLLTHGVLSHAKALFGTSTALDRDTVEVHFSRMAMHAHASLQHTPDHIWHGEHAAALLLLRELMHHLGFQTLLRPPPRQA